MAARAKVGICSISLNMTDRIRLIGVPPNLIDGLRESILAGWGREIQNERNYYGSHEFKLKGNPWHGVGSDAVMARSLISAVLQFMAKSGWNLVQSSDISKKPDCKDTMFFESCNPDPNPHVFAMSFNMYDRIRIIGPLEMVPHITNTLETHWPGGIQNTREYFGSFEWKLAGYPWLADGADAVAIRNLLNHILATLRSLGFKLYGSIDISIGQQTSEEKGYISPPRQTVTVGRYGGWKGEEGTMDIESWFFRKVGPFWG